VRRASIGGAALTALLALTGCEWIAGLERRAVDPVEAALPNDSLDAGLSVADAIDGGSSADSGGWSDSAPDDGAVALEAGFWGDAGAPVSGNTQSELDAATQAPTGTPAGMPAGAVATEIGLSAQYQINQAARTDYMVAPVVAIRNVSVREGVPLSSLKLRYYFTNEYSARCPANCVIEGYYANLSLGAIVDVERRYVQLDGNLACLEFSFENEKAVLRQGESVQTFQGFHISPYLPFDQSDDYSYDPKQTSFVDSKKLTIYKDGVLVWGAPP
jgi:endoglucanase